MRQVSRRHFLRTGGYVTVGFLGLRHWASSFLQGQPYAHQVEGYGELIRDPDGILDLPKGFSYTILSRTGDRGDDGLRIPGMPDGMAAFAGSDGKCLIVCNHELTSGATSEGPYGEENEKFSEVDRQKLYDAGKEVRPHVGGTSTLVYDPRQQRVEKHFLSLAGTCRNCAGGPTPWNSWITCEETTESRGETNEKDHGYTFEVPARSEIGLADPIPLTAMGRFNHEAVAVDPDSGVVYETEDRSDGLIYRFLPDSPGELAKGGRLQALAIRGRRSADTRNWPDTEAARFPMGEPTEVEWVDLEEVDSAADDLRFRGFEKGAARFARGEGMWYGKGEVYFACTNGGRNMAGQIFRYIPSPYEGTPRETEQPGKLELFIEPNNTRLLENADNLTVSPWGDLIICEDGGDGNYLRGVTPNGKLFTLGYNRYNGSEFAGACFAPDLPTLFVNIQRPGITLAITGPWEQA